MREVEVIQPREGEEREREREKAREEVGEEVFTTVFAQITIGGKIIPIVMCANTVHLPYLAGVN